MARNKPAVRGAITDEVEGSVFDGEYGRMRSERSRIVRCCIGWLGICSMVFCSRYCRGARCKLELMWCDLEECGN